MNALTLSRHSSWETCSEQEESANIPAGQNANATLRRRRLVIHFVFFVSNWIVLTIMMMIVHSLGRTPIRSRKSFKDRPASSFSGKSSSSLEEPNSSFPIVKSQPLDVGYYYDLDGNIESDDIIPIANSKVDSCGNISTVSSKLDDSRIDLVTAIVDHSFA